jgi:hypothetical protein
MMVNAQSHYPVAALLLSKESCLDSQILLPPGKVNANWCSFSSSLLKSNDSGLQQGGVQTIAAHFPLDRRLRVYRSGGFKNMTLL